MNDDGDVAEAIFDDQVEVDDADDYVIELAGRPEPGRASVDVAEASAAQVGLGGR